MVDKLKDISEKLNIGGRRETYLVKGISLLDGECGIHIISDDFKFYLKYKENRGIKLYGRLVDLALHRNIIVKEYTSSSLKYDENGKEFINLLDTLLPKDELINRGIFKVFNFYSKDELVLSLFFSYKEDGCGYKLIVED